ncbi:MAG TPA: hypothetical protein VE263_21055 [Candidatus Angelobacter sp.]|nr:hypothetical protein [Candidatus Angelobacter sp.]
MITRDYTLGIMTGYSHPRHNLRGIGTKLLAFDRGRMTRKPEVIPGQKSDEGKVETGLALAVDCRLPALHGPFELANFGSLPFKNKNGRQKSTSAGRIIADSSITD